MVSSLHKMVLSSGRFSGTDRGQLKAAFDAFNASPEGGRLVVHFHGGLVNQSNAEALADRLLPLYQGTGAHPLFVEWQSGILETLRNNWAEIVQEDIVPALIERVLQFVIGKLDQEPGEKGGDVDLPSRFAIQNEIQQKQALGEEAFAEREDEAAGLDAELSPAEELQLKSLLEDDTAVAAAAMKFSRPGAPELTPTLEAELASARAKTDPAEKGLFSTAAFVAAGLRVVGRVLWRFVNGRHHGIYTTVVEEVVRELKGDLIGGVIWKHMKKDTSDSFAGPGNTHGGTALIEELDRTWQAGSRPRIVLVGHSAGAIYIANLLKKVGSLPGDMRFEVVLLAPACDFQLLDCGLAAAGARIASVRSFAMCDELEKKDRLFPPLYPRSLLYFVSGVVETSVDLPLVGMQRFHSGFDAEYPEIKRVLDHAASHDKPWIWSKSELGPGLNTLAVEHGDFDDDEATMASVAHLVSGGGG